MPISPADLARSLGALDTLDVERGLAGTLQQVLRSAKTLFDADGAGLTLVDRAGALRWASVSDQDPQAVEGDREGLAQGPCTVAFAQRAPAAVRDLSAEPDWRELAQVFFDDGFPSALSVPVEVDGGAVGTLDIYVGTRSEWDASEVAALQAYAGLVASLLVAATTRVEGRLADQLQAALDHRLLIEQAVAVLIQREGLDAQAAFEWLRTAARPSGCAVVEVAREVVGGAPLPSDRLAQAKARRHKATDREVAVHRGDSDLHEGAAQRYERRGDPARAQTERLQAAAARGRITDAEAERRRADDKSSRG
jgi:ANTAR domain-containing protein/GAF domain-containing protein